MKAYTSVVVGFLVAGTPMIVASGTTSFLINLFSSSISAFILIFHNLRPSNCPSITSLLDLHKPTLVSCLASPRSIECRVQSSGLISYILPTPFGLAISMVKCLVSRSCPSIDKVFCFLAFTIADPEWTTWDTTSFAGTLSSFLFIFLSKVSSNQKSWYLSLWKLFLVTLC